MPEIPASARASAIAPYSSPMTATSSPGTPESSAHRTSSSSVASQACRFGASTSGNRRSARKSKSGTRSPYRHRLGALPDQVDLVGDQAVRLSVHRVRGLGVGRVDQAEDLPARLVDPVAQVLHA